MLDMDTYHSRPVPVKALQVTKDNLNEIVADINQGSRSCRAWTDGHRVYLNMPDGDVRTVSVGFWLVTTHSNLTAWPPVTVSPFPNEILNDEAFRAKYARENLNAPTSAPTTWTDAQVEAAAEREALTAERDRLRAALKGALDALVWCSGAHAFGPGGNARAGWLKVAWPAMDAAQATIDDGEAPTDAR